MRCPVYPPKADILKSIGPHRPFPLLSRSARSACCRSRDRRTRRAPPTLPGSRSTQPDAAMTRSAAIGRAKQPGITLAEIWQAYCDAGYPLLHGIGFLRPSAIKTAGYLWKHVSRARSSPGRQDRHAGGGDDGWTPLQGVGARSMALVQLKGLLRFADLAQSRSRRTRSASSRARRGKSKIT